MVALARFRAGLLPTHRSLALACVTRLGRHTRSPCTAGRARTGKVRSMRICARSGCNSPATPTLSYDRIALVAYLVTADDPTARQPGDLCERHVARLVLPRQWQLDDRRAVSEP